MSRPRHWLRGNRNRPIKLPLVVSPMVAGTVPERLIEKGPKSTRRLLKGSSTAVKIPDAKCGALVGAPRSKKLNSLVASDSLAMGIGNLWKSETNLWFQERFPDIRRAKPTTGQVLCRRSLQDHAPGAAVSPAAGTLRDVTPHPVWFVVPHGFFVKNQFDKWVCLKIVYPYTQWFCWSLSLLNGYNWGYTSFSDIPK